VNPSCLKLNSSLWASVPLRMFFDSFGSFVKTGLYLLVGSHVLISSLLNMSRFFGSFSPGYVRSRGCSLSTLMGFCVRFMELELERHFCYIRFVIVKRQRSRQYARA
jgi:hypothetical protein